MDLNYVTSSDEEEDDEFSVEEMQEGQGGGSVAEEEDGVEDDEEEEVEVEVGGEVVASDNGEDQGEDQGEEQREEQDEVPTPQETQRRRRVVARMRGDLVTEHAGVKLHLAPDNISGYTSVVPYKVTGKFRIEFQRNGKRIKAGVFNTAVDAAVEYARTYAPR